MKEQRECIITELLQSEKDYVSDLKLLHEIFMSNPVEAKVSTSVFRKLFPHRFFVIFDYVV